MVRMSLLRHLTTTTLVLSVSTTHSADFLWGTGHWGLLDSRWIGYSLYLDLNRGGGRVMNLKIRHGEGAVKLISEGGRSAGRL